MNAPDAVSSAVGWCPVFTLLLGYAISSLSEYLQHHRTLEREREARREVRRDKLGEQRNSFQRETIIKLQDAVMSMMQTSAEMHHEDMELYTQKGGSGSPGDIQTLWNKS